MRTIMFFGFLLTAFYALSQVPMGVPYQAVLRNMSGSVMSNVSVTMRFKILTDYATGEVVYEETHVTNTNLQGLVKLNIGTGSAVIGNFNSINWGDGDKYLNVIVNTMSSEIDLGTQQMMSVPYALYSGSVDLQVSQSNDTLFVGSDKFVIIPGISGANTSEDAQQFNPHISYGSMTDYEGHVYRTIKLDNGQEWMAENLRTAYLNGGTPIQNDWDNNALFPGWVNYDNNPALDSIYGKLYNWHAATLVCPSGWVAPAICDVYKLFIYLDANATGNFVGNLPSCGSIAITSDSISSKLRSANPSYWADSAYVGTNVIGFSAIGSAGYTPGYYPFAGLGGYAQYWTRTEASQNTAILFGINGGGQNFYGSSQKSAGCSIRCIKQ